MYDYRNAVLEDVKDYVAENYNEEELVERYEEDDLYEELFDSMWTAGSVTGNASGSYTFNTYKAEENLSHNWDLIEEVASSFGYEPTISDGYEHGAEWWDVAIRCYLLGECISEYLGSLEA